MRFRVFGIPTHVQAGFWIIALLLGYPALLAGTRQYMIVEWIAVVFVSILVHELGHAFAMIRHGLRPEITLYFMGGLTATQGMHRLSRSQRIFVAFAGPLAGFVLGVLVLIATAVIPSIGTMPGKGATDLQWIIFETASDLKWVNIGWGLINLIPVLPLDGGHILEDALGPKRARVTATLSVAAGSLVVLLCLMWDPPQLWIAFIFGIATWQSFQRFRLASEAEGSAKPEPARPQEDPIPTELSLQLRKAADALADDQLPEAWEICQAILEAEAPARARIQAMEIIGWIHLLNGNAEEARLAIKAIQEHGDPDLALVGAVLLAKEQHQAAREVFEAARAGGDDRKEIVGPLIQILIAQGEVARASAIALDIVETLNDDDVRQMAQIAFAAEAHNWSSRLSEALFERTGSPDDAYDAVRSRALEGDVPGALMLLRRAVAAGFTDAARVWSDAALERLRGEEGGELESLLPRPAE